ncbi:MAG TPA: recombinase family protein, partial [Methanomassiliicoccales archaeon]|nr:recombinase family protein [Methanomassiliicoccales archaeon]
MPRVALYTRVSTEDQAKEGYSLLAQMERLEAYCDAQGWDIAER